jgi:dienelactone hydrolase
MSRPAALVACVAILACCGGGTAVSTRAAAPAPGVFGYDRAAPLAYRDRGVLNTGWPKVHDVSFASPKGGRVTAYLVVPRGSGRHPAVIWMHGSGGGRRDLLVPAAWLSARGAVGLAIDAPDARTPAPKMPRGPAAFEKTRDLTVQNVVDLRRAVDVLLARPDVDPARIAYAGYSSGARVGAILAGVDHRIRWFDLLSGGATPVSAYVRAVPAKLRARLRRDLVVVDPLRYVRRAAPSRLFFQNGRRDRVVPHAALVALARAASSPKEIRWYPADHGLNAQALRDQRSWLTRVLGLRA